MRLAISGKLSSRLDFDELVFKQTIGEGSFGTVARGTWRNIDVAIKTLKETMVELSPEARADFLREVDLLERLRSPNIVAFMGAVITKKKMILVTEFSPLGSLDAVIRKYNLGEKLRLLFALDIAKGVSFLHTSGIIHRDLKPGNVLVFDLSPTAPTRCKLTDFGTSRAVAARTEIAMTKGLGTPLCLFFHFFWFSQNHSLFALRHGTRDPQGKLVVHKGCGRVLVCDHARRDLQREGAVFRRRVFFVIWCA